MQVNIIMSDKYLAAAAPSSRRRPLAVNTGKRRKLEKAARYDSSLIPLTMAAAPLLSLLVSLLSINGAAAVGRHLAQSPASAPEMSAPAPFVSAPAPVIPPLASAPATPPVEAPAPAPAPGAPAPAPLTPIAPVDPCFASLGGNNVTVLMVADPGSFSGSAEAKYLELNMVNKVELAQGNSYCPTKFTGTIMGQQILLVTTGIGPGQASICTQEILQCASHVREIVYSGTSGWSLQKGGVLNDDNCNTVNNSTAVNRIGDLCVSPFSVNWDCKQTDWNQQCASFPNLCYQPTEIFSINATFLYGECIFTQAIPASLALAAEIVNASRAPSFALNTPVRISNVSAVETRFWATMQNQTGVPYAYNGSAPPAVYDYTQCAEVDSQFFFSGAPFEMVARDYVARTINQALNTTLTKKDVQIANAMESIGLAMPIERYNGFNSTVRKIPYTVIRGMSNGLHGTVRQSAPGVWVPGTVVPSDFTNGYGFAIASFSSLIMTWLQNRCLTGVGAGNTTLCSFSLAAYGAPGGIASSEAN
ncbi:hypothetical protein KFL_001900070 [Klebsormidium nitens]|uniref:Nucleoside phosphorylase domain-containing protein n=1 Tax=Klebsormidium nitens TaxID=105231 RepID=A0A1Y1I0M1_KLENI|nr:hypothetical protein KFL_001900070 [Klebsormidium nitens]|eukprot:GAQ84464.1 hypothetical protein KFL_001900070 [Klebsormidium nitens]